MFSEIDPQITPGPGEKERVPVTEGERWLNMLGYFPIADVVATKVVREKEVTVRAGDFDQVCGDHVRGRFTKFGVMHQAYLDHDIKIPGYETSLNALQAAVREHFEEAFDETGQMIIPADK